MTVANRSTSIPDPGEAPRIFRGRPPDRRRSPRKITALRKHATLLDSPSHALQRLRRRKAYPPHLVPRDRPHLRRRITAALHPACAIECIHTYSLIHDDLPALDNDDLRRGKPTSHKQFGEATAILAGDALLTLAFEVVASTPVDAERRVAMLTEIATAAGTVNGMVGGQVADLEAEGKTVGKKMLEYIHRSKTAALIRASVTAGALCVGAAKSDVARLRRFGENIGWAFQVTDDILDVEESSTALGKTAGKDIAQQKATYPAVYGLERSHEIANDLATRAIAELAPFEEKATRLRDIAEYLVLRRA